MSLTIDGKEYEISDCHLFAYVIEPDWPQEMANGSIKSGIYWRLEVHTAETMSFWCENLEWPSVWRWQDLIGQTVDWSTPIHFSTGEYYGNWYGAGIIAGNSAIVKAKLCFLERSGNRFRVQWNGTASTAPWGCELDFPEETVSFEIDCWCEFYGVCIFNISNLDDLKKRELIAEFIDIGGLSEHFETIPSLGLRMLKPQ